MHENIGQKCGSLSSQHHRPPHSGYLGQTQQRSTEPLLAAQLIAGWLWKLRAAQRSGSTFNPLPRKQRQQSTRTSALSPGKAATMAWQTREQSSRGGHRVDSHAFPGLTSSVQTRRDRQDIATTNAPRPTYVDLPRGPGGSRGDGDRRHDDRRDGRRGDRGGSRRGSRDDRDGRRGGSRGGRDDRDDRRRGPSGFDGNAAARSSRWANHSTARGGGGGGYERGGDRGYERGGRFGRGRSPSPVSAPVEHGIVVAVPKEYVACRHSAAVCVWLYVWLCAEACSRARPRALIDIVFVTQVRLHSLRDPPRGHLLPPHRGRAAGRTSRRHTRRGGGVHGG